VAGHLYRHIGDRGGAGLTLSARNLMDEERPTHLPIRSYVAIGVRDTG
jgi:hypothetical protein